MRSLCLWCVNLINFDLDEQHTENFLVFLFSFIFLFRNGKFVNKNDMENKKKHHLFGKKEKKLFKVMFCDAIHVEW